MNHTIIISVITLVVVIATVIVYIANRLIKKRVEEGRRHAMNLNNIMSQALSIGDYYVIEHDLWAGRVRNISNHLLPDEGMSLEEFDSRFTEESRQAMQEAIANQVNDGRPVEYYGRWWNTGTVENPHYECFQGCAIMEADKEGNLRYIITTLFYITKEVNEERANIELTSKYRKMFDTTLVAMSSYTPEGVLIDLNEQMRQLCGFDAEGERFFRGMNMFDIPLFSEQFEPGSREDFHVCQHMVYPEIGIDKFIEFRLRSIYDENDELKYYAVNARDITEERKMYLDMHRQDEELRKTNDIVSKYEGELKYLLENSKMYVWQSDLSQRTIKFSRSLRSSDYHVSFDEYAEGVCEEERPQALERLRNMGRLAQPFDVIHHFNRTAADDHPLWYAISGMPLYDEQGNITGHFGIARDVTQLMDAQQKLKEETARAEDSGRQKSAFLANMTHELRTPLNSIVGFSDLLPMIDDAKEKNEMIRIIRNNCDMLLRLINDILEASTMSSNPISVNPVDVDFAQVFNDICQTLEQRVQNPEVRFIKDNPYSVFETCLDKERMLQVITNFVINAVKYTERGHIKVGYRYERGGIYMYCEDTGAGIPKDKQASVFERFVKLNEFVQGTGLGLSICQAIARRCGGKIGVKSEGQGRGSTFWVWIPCKKGAAS